MQFYDLHNFYNLTMKQINDNQSHQANNKGKTMPWSEHQNKITTNILCGILTVKLNHNAS